MPITTQFQEIIENIQSGKGAETIYGEPIEMNGKTLITVSKVSYGFGAGGGSGKLLETNSYGASANGTGHGEGLGFGAGAKIQPVGIIELTEESTRFIPINDHKRMLAFFVGGLVAAWLMNKLF